MKKQKNKTKIIVIVLVTTILKIIFLLQQEISVVSSFIFPQSYSTISRTVNCNGTESSPTRIGNILNCNSNVCKQPKFDITLQGSGYCCLPPFSSNSNPSNTFHQWNSFQISENANLTICTTGSLYLKIRENFHVYGNIQLNHIGENTQPTWITNLLNEISLNLQTNARFQGLGGGMGGAGGAGGTNLGEEAPQRGGNGGQGGNGGDFLLRGGNGANGGNGGNGGRGKNITFEINNHIAGSGNGGSGGAGGTGGSPSTILYIEANYSRISGNIFLQGEDGKIGSNGSSGSSGGNATRGDTYADGGSGGSSNGGGGGSGDIDTACKPILEQISSGGGGGGGGGKGANGGGGSGGFFFLKSSNVQITGNIHLAGGRGIRELNRNGNRGSNSKYIYKRCNLNIRIFGSVGGASGAGGGGGGNGGDGGNGSNGFGIIVSSGSSVTSSNNNNIQVVTRGENQKAQWQSSYIRIETYLNGIRGTSFPHWLNSNTIQSIQQQNDYWLKVFGSRPTLPYIQKSTTSSSTSDYTYFDISSIYYQFENDLRQPPRKYYLCKESQRSRCPNTYQNNSPKVHDTVYLANNNFLWANSNFQKNIRQNLYATDAIEIEHILDGEQDIIMYLKGRDGYLDHYNIPIKIDNYAPCDTRAIIPGNTTIEQMSTPTCALRVKIATNQDSIKIFAIPVDGGGSGIENNGLQNNVKIYLAKCYKQETECSYKKSDAYYYANPNSNIEIVRERNSSVEMPYRFPLDVGITENFPNSLNINQGGLISFCIAYQDKVFQWTKKDREFIVVQNTDSTIFQLPTIQNTKNVCGLFLWDKEAPGKPQNPQLYEDTNNNQILDIQQDRLIGNSSAHVMFPTNKNTLFLRWDPPLEEGISPISTVLYWIQELHQNSSLVEVEKSNITISSDNIEYIRILLPESTLENKQLISFYLESLAGNAKKCAQYSRGDTCVIDNFATVYFQYDKTPPSPPSNIQLYSLFNSQNSSFITQEYFYKTLATPFSLYQSVINASVTNLEYEDPTNPKIAVVFPIINDAVQYKVCWDIELENCRNYCYFQPQQENGREYNCNINGIQSLQTNIMKKYKDSSNSYQYIIYMLDASTIEENYYYFHVYTRDAANNWSVSSPNGKLIVDTTPPCTDSACSIFLMNSITQIDIQSIVQSLSLGYQSSISGDTIIPFTTFGDDLLENSNSNDSSIVMQFDVKALDNPNGSGFDFHYKNIIFGVGLNAWNCLDTHQESCIARDGVPKESIFWINENDNSNGIWNPLEGITKSIPIFQKKHGETYNYSYYTRNIPQYNNRTKNIEKIEFHKQDGKEVLRNIYIKVKDIANNWYTKNNIYQPIVVDTKPPNRIQQGTLKQRNNTIVHFKEIAESHDIRYALPRETIEDNCLHCYTEEAFYKNNSLYSSIQTAISNYPIFTINFEKPIDLSSIKNAYIKENQPPNSIYDGKKIAVSSNEIEISVKENFPEIYIWLEDQLENPKLERLPSISQYYVFENAESPFISLQYPCYTQNNSKQLDYSFHPKYRDKCRVQRIVLPYDGSPPVWNSSAYIYLDQQYKHSTFEFTSTLEKNIHFTPAIDNIYKKESGIRKELSYQICFSLSLGKCTRWIWASHQNNYDTEQIVDMRSIGTIDGTWYFFIKAFDSAGNDSAPENSPSKQITIDTLPPCSLGQNCSLAIYSPDELLNNTKKYSTNTVAPYLRIQASDSVSLVKNMVIAEYYQKNSVCYAQFFIKNSIIEKEQECNYNVNFSSVFNNDSLSVVSLYQPTVDYINFTSIEGIKQIEAIFQDEVKRWSAPQKQNFILDLTAPKKPISLETENQGWISNQIDTVRIQVKLPQDDISSLGAINHYGIKNVYYKFVYPPQHDKDGIQVPIENLQQQNNNSSVFSMNVLLTIPTKHSIYVWLEDIAGNINYQNFNFTTIQYDNKKPNPPSAIQVFANENKTSNPTIYFEKGYDNESGLEKYIICWSTVQSKCSFQTEIKQQDVIYQNTISNLSLSTKIQYTLNSHQTLKNSNKWFFYVLAVDRAGNQARSTQTYTYSNQPSYPCIQYLPEKPYTSTTVVSSGREEKHKFILVYQDIRNASLRKSQIAVDTNGNQQYEPSEYFTMHNNQEKTQYAKLIDGDYSNGEIFSAEIWIPFIHKTYGRMQYRYIYESQYQKAQQCGTRLQPFYDYYLFVNRYFVNFDALVQVRNNIIKPNNTKPIVFVFHSSINKKTNISISIISKNGFLVKKLIENKPYQHFTKNYVYLNSNSIRKSGVYYAIIQIGKERFIKPIVIIR